jgi:hypothetical protein
MCPPLVLLSFVPSLRLDDFVPPSVTWDSFRPNFSIVLRLTCGYYRTISTLLREALVYPIVSSKLQVTCQVPGYRLFSENSSQ